MKMGTEFWADHVAAGKRETISSSEYARRHGISVAALYYWQRKLKTPTGTSKLVSTLAKPAHNNPFVALHVLDKVNISSCPCTLVLPSELRLEMTTLPEPSWLVALGYAMQGTR